ncbi:HNH endonuclease (plasmid) [Helicobacter sp. NHP19-012]|uniref:HNH endonuclease n=1 Tax=Helicobacter gastrofelis TaxID=2849642 RepID=A0ABN6I9E8_9HELI|nr:MULTISPECIES: HNH endonuclease [unclassified Helicobacter]BCZ20018.1 HNH endonuclease [Helicobacter sp. NHP19-012]GMB96919.1 HNH endonuclease [Helicobacter sp. NHP22-001]
MPVNVDTEQLRQVITQLRFFRDELQQRTRNFLRELQEYYEAICEEYRNTKKLLEEARVGLADARRYEGYCKAALAAAMLLPPPWRFPAVATATAALTIATNKRKQWEEKVALLEQALEIYSEQIKRIESQLLEEAYQQSKGLLLDYDEEHNQLCRRSNEAASIIEQAYNIPPPQFQKLQELSAQLEALQEQLKPNAREQQIQEANTKYQELLEGQKEDFNVNPQNDFDIHFSEFNLPIFPGVFSTTIDLEHLNEEKSMLHFRAIKALQKALEERASLQNLFDDEEKAQINKGITPKGYLWHFDGNPPLGTMQLVREEILLKVPHSKGYPLWQQMATQLKA